MGEESIAGSRTFVAAPFIFFAVLLFQIIPRYLQLLKKRHAFTDGVALQLQTEIKQLRKEAANLSQPSTFAHSAKLQRLAAAKEKELEKYEEVDGKGKKSRWDKCLKVVSILKVSSYLLIVAFFWTCPVSTVFKPLVDPFGRLLQWRRGNTSSDGDGDYIPVGVIPWLILSTRVGRLFCQKIF